MSAPREVSREQVRVDPYIVWNEYVNLLAMSDYKDLTRTQRAAHLVFWYEHEIQNGGHLQYFENHGTARVGEVIHALRRLSVDSQADILSRAAAHFSKKGRRRIKSVEKYIEIALEGEFDVFDRAFHRCRPSLVQALEAFLAHNQPEFVVLVD
jgi:hypothetical protein